MRAWASAVVLLAAGAVSPGCGPAGGGAAGTRITFENSAASAHSIFQIEFDFVDISGLPTQVEDVDVAPGENVSFSFDTAHTQNLFEARLTWSDATTTTINLLPVALLPGDDFAFPVTH